MRSSRWLGGRDLVAEMPWGAAVQALMLDTLNRDGPVCRTSPGNGAAELAGKNRAR